MNDTYHYDEGATHNDHKRVIHIDTIGGADLGKLIGAFLKNNVEDAEIVEETSNDVSTITPAEPEDEELNYDSPKISLQQLLKQSWFVEVRTDERYNAAWTDAFVEALMNSEYGEQIARDWAVQGKREKKNQVKGWVIGLLADNCVLKGSYGKVATASGIMDNSRTFARYMGEGKKQPYAQWVKEYVGN